MWFYVLGLLTAPLVLPLLKPAIRGAVKGGVSLGHEVAKMVDEARDDINEMKAEAQGGHSDTSKKKHAS